MNKIFLTVAAAAFMMPTLSANAAISTDAPLTLPAPATVIDVEPEVIQVAHRKHGHRHKKKRYKCRKGQHRHKSRNYCHSHRSNHSSRRHIHIRNKHGDVVKIITGGALLYGLYKHLEDKW